MDLFSSSELFPIGPSPFTIEKKFTFQIDSFKNLKLLTVSTTIEAFNLTSSETFEINLMCYMI